MVKWEEWWAISLAPITSHSATAKGLIIIITLLCSVIRTFQGATMFCSRQYIVVWSKARKNGHETTVPGAQGKKRL